MGTYQGIIVSHFVQVCAALCISKGTDSQAVRGVELLHQEPAASLHNLGKLKKAGCRQQALNVVFFKLQMT